jgi:four helix bundle protein
VSASRRVGECACRRVGESAMGRDGESVRERGARRDGNGNWKCSMYNTFEDCVMAVVKHFRDLDVYQGAMALVMRVFELTKQFPTEERYALTDQLRRSSRSVCASLAEAWRKRRYPAAFISKLNDAEGEAAESQVHIEVAFRHGYLEERIFDEFDDAYDKVLGQIVKMIDQADRWTVRPRATARMPN